MWQFHIEDKESIKSASDTSTLRNLLDAEPCRSTIQSLTILAIQMKSQRLSPSATHPIWSRPVQLFYLFLFAHQKTLKDVEVLYKTISKVCTSFPRPQPSTALAGVTGAAPAANKIGRWGNLSGTLHELDLFDLFSFVLFFFLLIAILFSSTWQFRTYRSLFTGRPIVCSLLIF